MRKMMTVLLATTAMTFAAGQALAADATYKAETTIKKSDDGSYKKETNVESKDAAGRVATDVTVDRDVDSDGNVEKTTTVEKTNDPKGLWNKQTDKTKETVKMENGKVSAETKRTVNGDTVVDSKTTH